MTTAQRICQMLAMYLSEHPNIRFGQALFNLDINQFKTPDNPEESDWALKDIHGETDEAIMQRVLTAYQKIPN